VVVHEIISTVMIMDLVIHAREMIEEDKAAAVVVVVIIIDKDNVIVIMMMTIDLTVEQIDLVMQDDTVTHGKILFKTFPLIYL
jgi:hypothetical protein